MFISEQILTPVLAATEDAIISNMILKIMCESWLDHIYNNNIKFTQYGALQLLVDFAHVSTWIVNCPIISQEMRKSMLKNEVLRRCEGVGRLLLRSPGEHIKMNKAIKVAGNITFRSSKKFYLTLHMTCFKYLVLYVIVNYFNGVFVIVKFCM